MYKHFFCSLKVETMFFRVKYVVLFLESHILNIDEQNDYCFFSKSTLFVCVDLESCKISTKT